VKLSTTLALAAIRFYQRRLSPYKGFSCALAAGTGGASCSAYGYTVIARFGLRRGLGLLDRRLALCGHVHRRMTPPCTAPVHPRFRYQQGFCDGPCDLPCDAPGHCDLPCEGFKVLNCACDVLDVFSGCDGCGGSGRTESAAYNRWRKDYLSGRTRDPHHLNAAAERIRRQQERRREALNPRRPRAGGDPS